MKKESKPPELEWDGALLYVRNRGKRKFVGSIVRDSFKNSWSIWVRGGYKTNREHEEEARRELEKYA